VTGSESVGEFKLCGFAKAQTVAEFNGRSVKAPANEAQLHQEIVRYKRK
jgi:hypothetical protein